MATKERDLSAVSDADLELIAQGKYEALSEEGARLIAEAPEFGPETEKPKPMGFVGKMEASREALKKRGWENLSPAERLGLMALSAPGKMVEEVVGVKDFKKVPGAVLMRAVPVAVGQKLGEASRVPGAANVLGAIAAVGGEVAADLYEGTPMTMGKLLAAAGSGAVRGRALKGASATVKEAGRQGAINTALDVGETLVDVGELKAPSAGAFAGGVVGVGAQKVLDRGISAGKTAVRQADETRAYETVAKSAESGYPIFPREAVPNQFERATNALVRADLGLPPTAKLTDGTFKTHIVALTEPHRLAAKLSPEANLALTGMQEAQAASRLKYKQYKASMGNRPDLLDEADQFKDIADSFETDLINETRKLGKHTLAEDIIKNRPLLAKTYLAQRATNLSRGVADAKIYGDELKKNPGKLTGEAKIIGDTYNANQQKEFQMKNMLSRPVTIAQTVLSAAEHSDTAQKFSRNQPSFHQYPDLSADAARFVISRESRRDKDGAPVRDNSTTPQRVKLFLFGK